MSKKYFACVYGGASEKIDRYLLGEIEKLGKIIVENGYSLVYGAGSTGCMGAVARGVKEKGGYVMGISPNFMSEFEDIFECDNTVMVDTMGERKTLMEKHADVFFIAPGGIGTMDEFFQIVTLKYLKQIENPIVILNIGGFYDKLLELMDSLVGQKAVENKIFKLYQVVETVEDKKIVEILNEIKNI